MSLFAVLAFGAIAPFPAVSDELYPSSPPTATAFSAADAGLLDDLERASLRYFVEQTSPITGLVRDRAHADGSSGSGKASIAASGFALSALTIGVERGWLDRAWAIERARTQLWFLATKAPRVHGFFYHFMDMNTGARAWNCELSTIDTGLFLAGAVQAREYFHDPEITALVDRIYGEIDWQWFLNGGHTFAMGWQDETGFSRFRWMRYSELMMLTLLGMGAPNQTIGPEVWSAWERGTVGDYAGYHYIQFPALFVHQFTQAYIDFRNLRDAHADYFRNSVLATLAQRQFCANLQSEFPTWSDQMWGITSSDSAAGYKGGWGGPPQTEDEIALDGTLVPCAAAGSLPFTPHESMAVLRNMRSRYGSRIWQRYGFVDAFNPENGWVNRDVIGIDVGIQLLQAENARTGFVTSVFMHAPEVQRALERAGFLSADRTLAETDRDRIQSVAAQAWSALARAALLPETVGLQASALVAARTLGLVPAPEALDRARVLIGTLAAPAGNAASIAEYAAGLVTLRQSFPSVADEASARLDAIDWAHLPAIAPQLAALDRLAVFFRIATHARPATAWSDLTRAAEALQPVYVLAPANVRDQLLPGLWLDERSIITGASAAQLAYARALTSGAPRAPGISDPLTLALWLDNFPAVAARALRGQDSDTWAASATTEEQAALLLSAANLLVPNSIRTAFQADPLVQTGRAAIAEFAAARFGPNSSTLRRDELAGPVTVPPSREAIAVSNTLPRSVWHWVNVAGPEFRRSVADVRPGDPALALQFAFTWDANALYFHAIVTDGLPAVVDKPSDRNGVELFVDPANDGFVWLGDTSDLFLFRRYAASGEAFHRRPLVSDLRPTPDGYTIEARIAWSDLGIAPRPGLEIGVAPAVIAEGTAEFQPALELNWRYFARPDGRFGLGTLRLK